MKDLRIYLFVVSAVLLIYIVAQYNRPKATDWTETYNRNDKIPFGTFILYNRLNDIFPKAELRTYREPLYDVITNDSISNSTYLIINNQVNINDYDYNRLTRYVSKGNDVFIAADDFGSAISKKLKIQVKSEIYKNGSTYVNFVSKALGDSSYLVDHNCTSGYFSKFDTTRAIVLGQNGYEHATYLKISMGKGNLYLNANPLVFTNYSLLQTAGASYAAKSLSFLTVEKGLIWDEYYTQGPQAEGSTMRVFLTHPPLRWAFYIVIAALLIYVLYQSKRRQRIIPVIPPVANTSVEFVTTVGQVYYEQRDNSNIAQKQAAYFLDHLRTRYGVKTSVHDGEFIKNLSQKSGVDISLIQDIFGQTALIQAGMKVNNDTLIAFNRNIEQFYIRSK